jgi:hypothetical protein
MGREYSKTLKKLVHMKNTFLIIVLMLISTFTFSQFKAPPSLVTKTRIFERKFLWGVAFNSSWASYTDQLSDSAFYRPSLGGGLRAEYYFKPYLGIMVGAGIQQRGTGIYTPDLDNSIGNPDSTGRMRYRMTTFDFPVQIMYRHPKNILPNTRLSIGVGADFNIIHNYLRVWKSVDDGFHQLTDFTNDCVKYDIPLRATIGLDAEVGHGSLFKLQFYGEISNKKLYTHPISGVKSNQQVLWGVDLSVLF